MVLGNVRDNEKDKFRQNNSGIVVATVSSDDSIGMSESKIRRLSITNTVWTLIPKVLTGQRSSVSIQNRTGGNVYVNPEAGRPLSEGWLVENGTDLHCDINTNLYIMGSSFSSTITYWESAK